MPDATPQIIIIAGPNGAGKTTAAPFLLQSHLHISEFVNADAIAAGMSAFHPERVAMAAGRVMLERLRELATERASFAFETTLASRTFAPWIRELVEAGYEFHLAFLWLPNAEIAKQRVKRRTALGGHDVPAQDVERRYARGLANLHNLYVPLATTWTVYDSKDVGDPLLIARGGRELPTLVENEPVWLTIQSGHSV